MSAHDHLFTASVRGVSRRDFLRSTAALAMAAAIPRQLLADCSPTTSDILGPFYVNDPPTRTVLVSADEPGARLFMSGRVHGSTCTGGLEGAVVDVWHATDAGCYSFHQPCPDEDPLNCRGQMLTDAAGNYAFETILPAAYLNGATFRPRHLHYTVSPPAGPGVTTQLYFEGDPYIPTDPWASSPNATERIIPLTDHGGSFTGTWDINLDVTVVGIDEEAHAPTRVFLFQNYPNPVLHRTTIRYQLRRPEHVHLDVYTVDGRRVRRLVDREENSGVHTAIWDGRDDAGGRVTSGVYVYRLVAGTQVQARKLIYRPLR